jgi:hypothetical protein
MCTVLLPPGVNPIADNKYIYLFHYLDVTCVADGTHQTPTYSPLTCKHLLHYHGTKTCTAAQNRSVSSVFTQKMTACFTSTSVTNLVPGTSRDGSQWASYSQRDFKLTVALKLRDCRPPSPHLRISLPRFPIPFNPLKNTCQARGLQQTPTWSK